MNKLKKLIRGLHLLIKKPSLINLILEDNEQYREIAIKRHQLENGLQQVDFSAIATGNKLTVDPFSFLDGTSLPTDFALLRSLAERFKVKTYLEIGTWRGASVANIAQIVPECYTLNLPDEKLREMKLGENYIQSHRFFSKNLKNVKHLFGNSHQYDFEKLDKKFDMIFIDGDHHYEAVKKDTETAFKLLRDENSIIVWHDYAYSPEKIRWGVMLGILDGCPPDKRNKIFHVSNTLCAVFCNEKFETKTLVPYTLPSKKFKLDIYNLSSIII
ncbi:MAG: class I SAM-dependent methyltransferase [Chitinophagales bacterium]